MILYTWNNYNKGEKSTLKLGQDLKKESTYHLISTVAWYLTAFSDA
jgi:hypothetical protein